MAATVRQPPSPRCAEAAVLCAASVSLGNLPREQGVGAAQQWRCARSLALLLGASHPPPCGGLSSTTLLPGKRSWNCTAVSSQENPTVALDEGRFFLRVPTISMIDSAPKVWVSVSPGAQMESPGAGRSSRRLGAC